MITQTNPRQINKEHCWFSLHFVPYIQILLCQITFISNQNFWFPVVWINKSPLYLEKG